MGRYRVSRPDLAWLVVHRRLSYLGKGIERHEPGTQKRGSEKRVPVGGLMLDLHALGSPGAQRRAASEPGHRRWRAPITSLTRDWVHLHQSERWQADESALSRQSLRGDP